MERSTKARPFGSLILGLAAVLMGIATATAQEATSLYAFAAPADWVDVRAMDYDSSTRPDGATGSGRILLLDRQIDVVADGDGYYQHFAVELANTTDVDQYSQINVSVDPSFQTLAIHWLRVIRDGEVIDQRPVARITELPQETELANRIYNGNYNVNVLLADVRVGDVVDVALMWIATVFAGAIVFWSISSGLDTETTIAKEVGSSLRDLLVTLAWSAYMLRSRRVRATFVRRWRPRPVEREPAMLPAQ